MDKINISIEGMDNAQYLEFVKTKINFDKIVENVKWLYENKGKTEVVVKIPGDIITEDDKKKFYDTFGNYADRIFVENFAPCWPEFDVEFHTGVKITQGIYQNDISDTNNALHILFVFSQCRWPSKFLFFRLAKKTFNWRCFQEFDERNLEFGKNE